MADRVLRLGAGFVIGVWFARYVGPQDYGVFSVAVAITGICTATAGLGLAGIVVREITRTPSEQATVVGSALGLRMLAGLCVWPTAIVAMAWVRPQDDLARMVVAIMAAGALFQAADVFDAWFQAHMRVKYAVIARNAAFLCAALAKIWLLLARGSLIAFAWIVLVELALTAAALLWAFRRSGGMLSMLRVASPRVRQLMRDGWPLMLSSLMSMIYMRIDQVMIGAMVNQAEVGRYAAAVNLAESWHFIPMAIIVSSLPSVVAAREQGDAFFHARLQALYSRIALLGYAFAVPLSVLSTPIMQLLFGSDYAEAGPVLAILVWGGVFATLGAARTTFLTSMNWTRLHSLTVLLGCVANIALNLVLIPRYGALGAAIATTFSYWLAAHGACFVFPPLFRTGGMLTHAMLKPGVR